MVAQTYSGGAGGAPPSSSLKLPGTEVAAWVQRSVSGHCPLRKGASFTRVGDRAYVIGGRLSDGTVTNDVHVLEFGPGFSKLGGGGGNGGAGGASAGQSSSSSPPSSSGAAGAGSGAAAQGADGWSWTRVHCDSSRGPSVRECHSATYIGNGRILVFGGQLYIDALEVYGDVFIFDTQRGQWEVPEIDGKPPSARSRHTATYCAETDTVYIFGGYRKTTRRLNDVYELNLDTMTWSSPSIDGDPPAPRYGHSACLLGTKLFVMGGIDGTNNALRDVAMLDVQVRSWIEVPDAARLPRAAGMFSAVAVESAGAMKVFTFGGQTSSIMDFNMRASYLDTKYMEWKDAKITGGVEPPPVADCSAVYDARSKSVVIFGGAGQQYLDRVFSLDVSAIVGPDYAMFSLSPPMGPLHGGMTCRILGSGFRESHDVSVLLTDGRREVVVKGERTGPEEVAFSTPDLSVFGERTHEVLVRLSLGNNGGFTVNHVPFTLYLDTEARNCVAYGPGVLDEAATRLESSFIIWAKNMSGQDRTHGGEAFVVSVREKKTPEQIAAEAEEEAERQRSIAAGGASSSTATLRVATDDRPSSSRSGPGTPRRRIGSARPKSRGTDGGGNAATASSASDAGSATGNGAGAGDDAASATGNGGAGSVAGAGADGGAPAAREVPVEITDLNNGTYECRFAVQTAGLYEVDVEYNGVSIRGSPFEITFRDELVESQPRPVGSEINFVPVMKVEVPRRLAALEESAQHEQSTLALQVKDGNVHTLIKVMSCIDSHTVSRDRVDLEVESLREAIQFLKVHHDPHADSHRKRLRALEQVRTEVKDTAASVDRDLAQHKVKARVGIKARIEEFNAVTEAFEDELIDHAIFEAETPLLDAYHDLDHTYATLAAHEGTAEELVHLSNLFGFLGEVDPSLERLRNVRETLAAFKKLWDTWDLVECHIDDWKKVTWPELQPDAMELRIKEIGKELRALDRRARDGDTYAALAARVKNFQQSCPLVVNLRHPSMRERHWKLLMDITGVRVNIHSSSFNLGDLLALDLPRFEDDVDAIVDRALKEEKMEKSLAKLKEIWDQVLFVRSEHQGTAVELIKISEEDVEQLENDQLVVQSMMGSKYMMTFERDVLGWKRGLNSVEKVTTIWGEIQRTWAYLVALFIGSEEVKRDLPEDAVRFAAVDKEVTAFLRDGVSSGGSNVYNICTREGLYESFCKLQESLELCEKSLFEYLDSKRMAFPRFYFVSTTDLLDILCNGNQPAKIMVHMPKVFQAIRDLALDESSSPPSATALISAVGKEEVPLDAPLQLTGKVEEYLANVILAMQGSLRASLKRSIAAYASAPSRTEWLRDHPSQIVMVTTQAAWTSEIERAFSHFRDGDVQALRNYRDVQKRQLDDLIEMVTGDLDKPLRQKVMVLITLDTHARDVTDTLINEYVESPGHFRWQSQLRYSWDDAEDDMVIRITDARFRYGYEYLGNGARLVITPLTDRIYITATQSLHLRLGCAPAGPAGTGKTETTKDLASQLGKPCYVFNCSDQMDYKGMGNIFKGLAASGSWGCFDEFNRLIPEVLSVCSQQFKAVLDAIKGEEETFTVEGATLKLNPTCGVFITMNPGYLGRTELPETLKTLFRPITVVVPDLELICENMLMAEGFKHAKILARKFTTLYALLRDLLSKQDHYDWGLRAIKAVLVVAGSFKRAEPEIEEADLLMRALRDSNLAKIPDDDVPVFMGLMGDLFPGTSIPRKRDEALEDAVKQVCGDAKAWPELGGRSLTPEESFVLKVVQLDELLAIRHCVFIIGSSGTGKSTVWKTLSRAWTEMGRPTTVRDINPKAISSDELYGYVELASREWKDGLLSNVMREIANVPDEDPKWIVLDGDLDANWIESMNSVMDDNRILTLASNERIPLRPHCRMIFEIRDLVYATPATVSRAGIIYMSEGEQWRSFVQSWTASRAGTDASETSKTLLELFDRYVPDTLRHVQRTYHHIVPVVPFNLVQSLCYILEGLLDPEELGTDPGEAIPAALLETYFVFAAVWAFGSALAVKDNVDHRQNFSDWWKETHKTVRFPPRGSVFDVFVDGASGKFVQWRSVVEEIAFDSTSMLMRNVTVPIAETTSVGYFMDHLLRRKRPLMLVGNAGCGKTALVRGLMQSLPEDMLSVTISLNYYSDSATLQRSMEEPLEKKAGRNYGPPGTKSLIYFVDDLNMPMLDPYNTQTPIALIRQHLDYGHWYDREKLSHQNLKKIDATQYICAMNPASGSFTVNPRLQRHFVTFALDLPSPGSLMDIYRTFLVGHLQPFDEAVQQLVTKIVHATLLLHTRVTETFRKTAVNFHYEFNMRHIANVFQGLLLARPGQFAGEDGDAKFVQLWLHECERVYCDRLVSAADIKAYRKLAKEANSKHFANFNLGHLLDEKNRSINVFCPFAHGTHDKVYDRVETMDELRGMLEEALGEYNEENAQMNLLLFEDAIRHVCRITRIIEAPSGHALLVGVGGSGKQSLSRLAAFVSQYSVVQIAISGTYSMNDLKEDLRRMFIRAGQKDEGLVFLLTEAQIADERFLVYINDLLSSGEIPELFAVDDRDQIVNAVRLQVKAAGIEDTRDNCWAFFLDRVRANLHVALCFSPLSDSFRVRLRRFPALVTCTVIDWFHPWPRDALLGVAKRFLAEVDLGDDRVREGVEQFMPFSYEVANRVAEDYLAVERRSYHTTPKSYLELISLFKSMLAAKRQSLRSKIERLQSGIGKLEVTSEEVAVLQETLREQSVVVEEKKLAAEVFAEQVGREKSIVEAESAKANAEAEECEAIQETVSVTRERCERELEAAEPAVKRAEAALNTLNKKELTEMKSMSRPPAGVDDVLAAVLVLTSPAKGGVPKMDKRQWANSLVLMSKVDTFISMLMNFKNEIDAQNVPAKNFKEVRYYLGLKHFNKDAIYVKSKAASGLCEWVINIVEYYDIFCKVEPMRQALADSERQLEEANTRLEDSRARVADLQAQLDTLLRQYDAAEAEKQKMIDEVNASQAKLDLAQRLVAALESENVRWRAGVESLHQDLGVVVGDVLLSSAFVSYIGGFSKRFRDELITSHWVPFLTKHGVPMSAECDALRILTDDSTIAAWQNQGLPADRVSVENAAIVSNAERWPLIIDPQLQGIAWLKEKEAGNDLVVLRLGQKNLAHKLEDAIIQGHSVLIENIGESIDAMLGPVIARQTIRKLGVNYMKIGDREVEHNPNFRLFLHTKLSNPHYPPEIQAETTLVNFAVTEAGLEDQMLAIVVRSERPELEEQKSALIKQQNEFKIKLKELEDDLLERLANAEGDLTEDVPLIENLEESKRVATEIQEKVEVARVTEEQINEAREAYRPVAARGALLFFLLRDLRKINVFYEYSLNSFVTVFHRGIDATSDPTRRRAKSAKSVKSAKSGKSARSTKSLRATAQSAEPSDSAAANADAGADADADTGADANADADADQKNGADGADGDAGAAADADADAAANADADADAAGGDSGSAVSELSEDDDADIDDEDDDDLTEEQRAERLAARITNLLGSVTYTVFNYTRRGLFERHKLIFAVQLSLSIAEHAGGLDADELDYILHGREIHGTKPERERLSRFLNDDTWARVAALCQLPTFSKFAAEINKHADGWDKWCSEEKPEALPMPKDIKAEERSPFQRLLIVRALRPDRLTAAMTDYVRGFLGDRYVDQPPFHLPTVFDESSTANPIMFILFPGAQPVKDVEALANERGVASRLFTVSMGQGQEPIAEAKLDEMSDPAGEGGWVFLDNMHLMQSWLPLLERKLELIAESGHPDFRCFFSAEPSSDPQRSSVPEGVLQSSIKIVNEPPSDLRANLKRAFAQFTPEYLERAAQPDKFKPALYALCFFHALVLGRRKFGSTGWSRHYSFNMGDLTICAGVLNNYLAAAAVGEVPFDDLRYVFGEIMYGGHITDHWDRRTNNTYLDVLLKPDIYEGVELAPGFESPAPGDYAFYAKHIEEELPRETPQMFGLHPNAEINLLTNEGHTLFRTLLDMKGAVGGGGTGGKDAAVLARLEELRARLPEEFDLAGIIERVAERTPTIVIVLQETARMNTLLARIRRSLDELALGLKGALNISEGMEALSASLFLDTVPATWEQVAYPSMKGLSAWFIDLGERAEQLRAWSDSLEAPPSVWISGLFNPQALFTAIVQKTARETNQPLDAMGIETTVTKFMPGEVLRAPSEGAYVHGFYIDGCRWDVEQGILVPAKLKELVPVFPVIHCKAVPLADIPSGSEIYECPVYKTPMRGPTYVMTAQLPTEDPPSRWILAGVALLLSTA